MIAIESLLFLLGGIALAVVLIQVFGRRSAPVIRLVRSTQFADGHEETRLMLNDNPILTASTQGQRLADYADEVERLEQVASRMGAALGAGVELTRVEPPGPQLQEGVPVRRLPKDREQ